MAGSDEAIPGFIARWQGVAGPERTRYQLFLTELASAAPPACSRTASADDGTNAPALSAGWCSATTTGTRPRTPTGPYWCGAFVQDSKEIKGRGAATTLQCSEPAPNRRSYLAGAACGGRGAHPCNDQFERYHQSLRQAT